MYIYNVIYIYIYMMGSIWVRQQNEFGMGDHPGGGNFTGPGDPFLYLSVTPPSLLFQGWVGSKGN